MGAPLTVQENQNIRVVANRNDLFLAKEDVAWIESTFDPAHVTFFEHGGHLGNLSQPAVQLAVLNSLDGLGAIQNKSQRKASLSLDGVHFTQLGEQELSQAFSLSNILDYTAIPVSTTRQH